MSTRPTSHGGIGTSPRRLGKVGTRLLPVIPAPLLSLLPAGICPACWPAYAGVLGSLGIGFLLENRFLLPLTVFFLVVALVALGYRARRRRGFGPFWLGLAAALVMVIGRFIFLWNPATYAGAGLLVAASLWNAWPVRARQAVSCPACAGRSARSAGS